MAFSQGSRSSLSYIVESTFGTTPSGNFTSIPFSTHTLNLAKDRVAGTDIQADRMPRHDRHGNKQVAGEIVADLRKADYDPFIESVMNNAFGADSANATVSGSSNVVHVGTTPKFFSIEDYAADIDQARLFTGCTVSSMAVSIAPNQMVTSTFSLVGKDMSISGTEKTLTAASANSPYDAYSGSIGIGNLGGSTSSSTIVTAVDFTLNNSNAPTYVVGSDAAPQLETGRAEIEGTMSVYFEDAAMINRFINETETELNVQVGDGTNTLDFNFPRLKINSADVGVDGPTSRIITMSFVGLYYATDDTNLKITRSA